MRTTVSIDDNLLERAKRRARQLGLTLGQLMEAALRRELSRSREPEPAPDVPVFHGTGVCAGVDLSSTRALLELLDRDVPLEKLR